MNNLISSFEEHPLPEQGKYHFDEVDFKDPRVFSLISSGRTKGIFQLESQLGQMYAKKLKPDSLQSLADLISIIRPVCLAGGLSDKFCDIKNGKGKIEYLHPCLEPILSKSLGFIIYQEQVMAICSLAAGFTELQADDMRKATGHKDAKLMNKVKEMFLEGCKKTKIVDDETAIKIFDQIQSSVRYSFNACLTPDTIIETKNGFKTLEELEVGEKILAPSEDKNKDEFVEVLKKYDNGIKDVFEIELESGKTIHCTMDHKFLCKDGKIRKIIEILEENLEIMTEF